MGDEYTSKIAFTLNEQVYAVEEQLSIHAAKIWRESKVPERQRKF